jgi:hypothetical protein
MSGPAYAAQLWRVGPGEEKRLSERDGAEGGMSANLDGGRRDDVFIGHGTRELCTYVKANRKRY